MEVWLCGNPLRRLRAAWPVVLLVLLGACTGRPAAGPLPTVAPTALPAAVVAVASPTAAPTRQPTAQPTPTPEPTPCQYAVLPALAAAWDVAELGCPLGPGRAPISTAYAPFEGGEMLWRGDLDQILVLYGDGAWARFANQWQPGDPVYTCGEESSPPTPVRGFGRVWCDNPAVREGLGAVTAAEIGDGQSAAQDFVNGSILTAPFGGVYVLVGERGVWRRVDD